MPKKLPGEDIEIVLEEYDKLKLGDVYDIACKLEKRGNTGLALKIYEYAVGRFGVTSKDTAYERVMGALMYNSIGKLRFLKEDYALSDMALGYANMLAPGNYETAYWKGCLCYATNKLEVAREWFTKVIAPNVEAKLVESSKEKIKAINELLASKRSIN